MVFRFENIEQTTFNYNTKKNTVRLNNTVKLINTRRGSKGLILLEAGYSSNPLYIPKFITWLLSLFPYGLLVVILYSYLLDSYIRRRIIYEFETTQDIIDNSLLTIMKDANIPLLIRMFVFMSLRFHNRYLVKEQHKKQEFKLRLYE